MCVMSTFTYIRRATAKLWTTPAFRFSCHGPNGQAGVLWNWPPHRKPWIRKHTAQDRLHVGHRVCYVHIYVCIPIDRAVTFIWLPETALNTGKGRNPNVQGSACSGGTFGGCEEGGAFTGGGCEEGGAFTGWWLRSKSAPEVVRIGAQIPSIWQRHGACDFQHRRDV